MRMSRDNHRGTQQAPQTYVVVVVGGYFLYPLPSGVCTVVVGGYLLYRCRAGYAQILTSCQKLLPSKPDETRSDVACRQIKSKATHLWDRHLEARIFASFVHILRGYSCANRVIGTPEGCDPVSCT